MGAYRLNGLHACWVRASRLFGRCGLKHFAGVDIRWSYNTQCNAPDSAPRPFSGPFTRNLLICYLLFAIREAPLAPMRRSQILNRAKGYDPGRVDIVMGIVVVPLDMIEVNGFSDSWLLIQIA
jgi:hypothetical protein